MQAAKKLEESTALRRSAEARAREKAEEARARERIRVKLGEHFELHALPCPRQKHWTSPTNHATEGVCQVVASNEVRRAGRPCRMHLSSHAPMRSRGQGGTATEPERSHIWKHRCMQRFNLISSRGQGCAAMTAGPAGDAHRRAAAA